MEIRTSLNKDSNWRQHRDWAMEAVDFYLLAKSSEQQKKILQELSKNPQDLVDFKLSMSTAFAYVLLEKLAQKKGCSYYFSISTVVDRGLQILLEFEKRFEMDFSRKTVHEIFRFLEVIETPAGGVSPLWSVLLNDEANAEKGDFQNNILRFNAQPTEFNKVNQFIYGNEPFLAWKELQDIECKAAFSAKDEFEYKKLLSFGLFADAEMIKSELRKINVLQSEGTSLGSLCLFATLLVRGEYSWVQSDKTLFRPFERLIEAGTSEWSLMLMTVRSFIQAKTRSRLYKQLEAKKMLNWIFQISAPEIQLLAVAVLHSLLRREHWISPTQVLARWYKELSMQLSDDLTEDLWNLLSLPDDNRHFSKEAEIRANIPVSKLARNLGATSITFKLTQLLGPRRFAKILSGQGQLISLSDAEIEKILSLIIPYLSKMKGPLMKLGQTLSYSHFGLPENLSSAFKSLQSESSPLDFTTIFSQIQKNEKLHSQIVQIDSFPVGVGSIGQVHRARLQDGRDVAIKVQFPQIESVIREDLDTLKFVVGIIEFLIPRYRLSAFVKELKNQILLECDYLREAHSQEFHRQQMQYLKSLYIPEVYLDLCSKEILVSEYVEGLKFEQACQLGTQEQKDLWGQALVEYTVTSCRNGHFNSDPHPGNFLFQEDRLVYFDFGSVRIWNTKETNSWNYLIMSCLQWDPDLIYRAMNSFENTGITLKNAEQLSAILNKPFPGSWTVPGYHALQSEGLYVQMQGLTILSCAKNHPFHLPKEFLLGIRVYFGHMSVVVKLGSKGHWHTLVHEIMRPWSAQHLP